MKKPGRPKKNLNINIDTKKVDVKVTRKDGKTDIKIDTPKVDVDIVAENNVTIAAKKGIKMGAPGGVTITEGSLMVKGAISSAAGVSGTFTTPSGKVVEVLNGVVVNIS